MQPVILVRIHHDKRMKKQLMKKRLIKILSLKIDIMYLKMLQDERQQHKVTIGILM